jgi:hypothetical protein
MPSMWVVTVEVEVEASDREEAMSLVEQGASSVWGIRAGVTGAEGPEDED